MCEFDGAWVWWWRWWCGQQLSWHRAGGCREIGSRKKGRAVHWNTTTHQYYCLLPNTFWIMHNCNTICSLNHILKKRLKAGIRWQVLDRLIFLKPKKKHFCMVPLSLWCIDGFIKATLAKKNILQNLPCVSDSSKLHHDPYPRWDHFMANVLFIQQVLSTCDILQED